MRTPIAAHIPRMSSIAPQTRQPAGRPTGGQFATLERDEANIALEADYVDFDSAGQHADVVVESLTDREMLTQALALSRQAATRANLTPQDIEDIAQETVFSVLQTQKRAAANGEQRAITGGLLRIASRAITSRYVDSHSRHEDSKALAIWKRKVEEREAEAGRHLNRLELDELAQNIRDTWPNPRHRPRVGFQHETRVTSFEAHARNLDDTLATDSVPQGGGSDRAHELADRIAAGEVSRADAKRAVWNALSADFGTAKAIEGALTKAQAASARKSVENAAHVAAGYLAGSASDSQAEALFAPFGALTERERRHIAKTLDRRPNVAHQLWGSAVDFADKRFAS